MPERYKYEYLADIFLSVCYICSTNMDLSVIFFAEFFVFHKTLFWLYIQCAMCTFCTLIPIAGYILNK
jgi:hypothetical protein